MISDTATRRPWIERPVDAGPVVLVVEDEPAIRNVMARILRRLGCRPLLAANGTDGLRLYDRNAAEVRIVLLDWQLPGVSGKETLASLLARDAGLRIALVTGSADAMYDPRATQDCVSILLKPFTPTELGLVVRTLLVA